MQEKANTPKLSLSEAIFQAVFLINNNRFESALEVVKTNDISLSLLSENKSINHLEDFKGFIKNS